MKEVFDKIRNRLKEIWVDNRCGDCVHKSVCDKVQEEAIVNDQTDLCGVTIKAVALSIVSEVEAEYINKSTEHINKSSDCSTNWIDVKDRLPENDDDVLIYYQYKILQGVNVVGWKETQGVGYYYSPSNDWIFYGGFGLDRHAIAWMPLPEPYKPIG